MPNDTGMIKAIGIAPAGRARIAPGATRGRRQTANPRSGGPVEFSRL